ncbi:MAG: hypothetical protein KC503_11295 [Myxococcales bacterium]|nr:hypothetical protein [Myxococcales bacterium]
MRFGQFSKIASLLVVLAAAGGCGDNTSRPGCSVANCPNGCCDANGVCMPLSFPRCGLAGSACSGWTTCTSQQTCDVTTGQCRAQGNCTAATCPNGCCDQAGNCQGGTTATYCGQGGVSCTQCAGNQQCVRGICAQASCTQATCPTGCCFEDKCVAGTSDGACGKGGAQCASCNTGQQCVNQACATVQCDSSTCSEGCCNSSGQCVPGTTAADCGTGGVACKQCNAGSQICNAGSCATAPQGCNPTTCPNGCCDKNGTCVTPTDQACGSGGAACTACGSNQICSGGKCTCTAFSCSGCCDGDACRSGSDDSACGSGGSACAKCSGADKCVAGSCKQVCDFSTCSGCCQSGQCNTSGASDKSACGVAGNLCKVCGLGESCSGGTCNDAVQCSASGCSGCCKEGQCLSGSNKTGCGSNGNVCSICGAHQQCVLGSCEANPTSTWDVSVASVTLDSSVSWDSFLQGDPAPDVYVKLTIGGVTKQTKTINNNYTPMFNEYLMTVKASDLTSANAVKYEIYDEDVFIGDDKIAECSDRIFQFELEAGKAHIPLCISGAGQFIDITAKVKTAQ